MAADPTNIPTTTSHLFDSLAESDDDANATPQPPSLPTRPTEELLANPQVASLRAIFPDFDLVVLQSVLESVDGDQDRAIDKLLGMNDPEYEARRAPDQTELDEQFARQLMLEEQERHRWQAPSNNNVQYQPQPRSQAPGQAGAYPGAPTPSGNTTAKPDFQDVTDTFNKIAESGKKTFSTLFSKVKAKMQEFDQSRNDPYATGSGTQVSSGVPSHQDRHTLMQQSYYDPNFQPHESQAPGSHVQGYSLYPAQPSPQQITSDSVNGLGASTDSSRHSSDIRGLSSSPPPSNIDPSKLGLLPKRPVSLISSSPPPNIPATAERDELEYAENPFEEDARRK